MIFSFLLGTAFIAGGNILTAEHVVKPHTTEYVSDHIHDTAVIYMDLPQGFNTECRKLKTGEKVTVKGYPFNGYEQVYTEIETTVISDGVEIALGRKSIMLATSLAGGFSGSPVFDSDGDVVAIVTDRLEGVDRSLASSICSI